MNALNQLRQYSTIVVDSGLLTKQEADLYKPQDATTNPSLLLKASGNQQYQALVADAIDYAKVRDGTTERQVRHAMDKLAVNAGVNILNLIPGRVSTEVPAIFSYDTKATTEYAVDLIRLYEDEGIHSDRVLIKIASTWQGIQAAKELEKDGIHCNLTLLFAKEQAIACADAGVTLISPFVGRIYDWHMKNENRTEPFPAALDPGVISVTDIYNYFKAHGIETEVMGASFRNSGEILQLAGCELLTIAPKFLEELEGMEADVPRILIPDKSGNIPELKIGEQEFYEALRNNPMASEKLSEGIRQFDEHAKELEQLVRGMLF